MLGMAFLTGFLFFYSRTTFSPVDASLLALLLFACASALKGRDGSFFRSRRHISLLVFGALALVALAVHPEGYWFTLTTLYLAAAYAAVHYLSGKEARVRGLIMKGYAVGAVVSSFLGVAAYALLVVRPSMNSVPLIWNDGIRLSAFFDDPVVYGAFLVPALLLLSYLFATTERAFSRTALAACAAAVYLNLVLTGSRGAWLNALVALLVFAAFSTEVRRVLFSTRGALMSVSFAALALLVVFVVPVRGATYYATTLKWRVQSSDMPRLETWQESPALVSRRPSFQILFGSGGGSFPLVSSRRLDAHNVYLKTLYEYGVLGFPLIAVFFFLTAREALSRAKEMSPLHAIIVASLVGIAVQGAFVDVLHWRHLWLLAGLA